MTRIGEYAGIRAILLECTELPPYADALRYATGLPVYDAITTADSFVDGCAAPLLFSLLLIGWGGGHDVMVQCLSLPTL